MPIYEYRCGDCGHAFQLLQRIGADATGVACPQCSSSRVERLLSCFASTPSGSSASQGACCPAPT